MKLRISAVNVATPVTAVCNLCRTNHEEQETFAIKIADDLNNEVELFVCNQHITFMHRYIHLVNDHIAKVTDHNGDVKKSIIEQLHIGIY